MQKRYNAMVTAMDQMHIEPVIIEDLVKFGEDRGFDRGFDRGTAQQRMRIVERRMGRRVAPTQVDFITARLAKLDDDRFCDLVFTMTPAALEAWIADPTAT